MPVDGVDQIHLPHFVGGEVVAVGEIGGERHVFVVRDGRARLTKITIGIEGDDFYEITGGLKEGDKVVVAPPAELKNGRKVE